MADLVERLRIVARTTVHVRFDAAEPFVADIIVEAADRIAALEADGWQPIKTAPKDWSDVLLFVPDLQSDHRTVCEGFYDAEEKSWRSPSFREVAPTHWRPLPAPPQDNREG